MLFRYDVFVSYSHSDFAKVRRLVDRLSKEGIKAWFDKDEIPIGKDPTMAISRGLLLSRHFLACWSRNARKSEYARFEAMSTHHRNPENVDRSVIPLRLDKTPLEGCLNLEAVDWRSESDKEFRALIKVLKAKPEIRLCSYTELSVILGGKPALSGLRSFAASAENIHLDLQDGNAALMTRTGVNWWELFFSNKPQVELRMLVVNPLDVPAMRIIVRTDKLEAKAAAEAKELAEVRARSGGIVKTLNKYAARPLVKVRTMDYVPPWTILRIDPRDAKDDRKESVIYVELATQGLGSDGRPVLRIGERGGWLFDFFAHQFERSWADADAWPRANGRKVANSASAK